MSGRWLAAAALALFTPLPVQAQEEEEDPLLLPATVTIDFAAPRGDSESLVGFINGPFPSDPEDVDLILDINPTFYRAGPRLLNEWERVDGYDIESRMVNVGTEILWLLPDGGDLELDPMNPHLYLDEYELYIRNLADYVVDEGFTNDLIYSFWNEGNRVETFEGTHFDFLDTFTVFHDTLREELGDEIEISAPSYGYFGTGIRDDDNDRRLTSFFDNALVNGLKIDYLGLHIFARIGIDFDTVHARLDRYWEKFGPDSPYAAVGIQGFIIDETMNDDDHLVPAANLAWFHLLDSRDDVFRASRSAWDDRATACTLQGIGAEECVDLYGPEIVSVAAWNDSLNGIITHNEFEPEIEIGPRPSWWVYRYYAQGLTSRVSSTSDNEYVVAMSNLESDAPDRTQTLVGYFAISTLPEARPRTEKKAITLVFENVAAAPQFAGATAVRADIRRIPYENFGLFLLPEPELVTEGAIYEIANDGTVTIELPDALMHEVHQVQLYPLASPDDEPRMAVNPATLDLELYEGTGDFQRTVRLSNAGGGVFDWRVASNGTRFTFQPQQGVLGWGEFADVEMTVDLTDLPDGEYGELVFFDSPTLGESLSMRVDFELLQNDTPVAFDVFYETEEEEVIEVNVDFVDDEQPGPYSVEITQEPTQGSVTEIELGRFRYDPGAGFAGDDTFLWTVSDGVAASNEATATISIAGIPEIAANEASFSWEVFRGTPDVAASFVLSNVGLGDLNWVVENFPVDLGFVFTPASGVVEPGGSVVVSMTNDISTAEPGEFGGSIGVLDTEARNHPFELPVTLVVLENLVPVAIDQAPIAEEGGMLLVELQYNDDGVPGPYTFTLVEPPTNGTLTQQSLTTYLYEPDPGFLGIDTFQWSVHDGIFESNVATVNVGVNQIPIAEDQSISVFENDAVRLTLGFSDDGLPGPYSVILSTPPTHGTLTEEGLGQYTYTPNLDYVGADAFEFVIDDGFSQSVPGTVTINVAGVPEISTDKASIEWEILEGTPEVAETLLLTNAGSATLNWVAETLPADSVVIVTPSDGALEPGASVTLDVAGDTTGVPDGLFTLSIGLIDAAASNSPYEIPVTLTVLDNAVPVALDQSVLTEEGAEITITLAFEDDGIPGPYTVDLITAPANGTVDRLGASDYLYTPNAGFVGNDRFEWSIHDGLFDSNVAEVTIGVNQVPVVADQSFETVVNQAVPIQLTIDDDGVPGPFSVVITEAVADGVLVEDDLGLYTYTPNLDFVGTDSFRFFVEDGFSLSNEATATIVVSGVAEIATDVVAIEWTAFEGESTVDQPIALTNVGTAELEWTAETLPAGSIVSITPSSGSLAVGESATLDVGALLDGIEPGTFGVSVGILDPAAANSPYEIPITLTMNANQRPVGQDQSVVVEQDGSIAITPEFNDDGIPGPYTIALATAPLHGAVVRTEQDELLYTPDAGFFGADSFDWTIDDGAWTSEPATVAIGVNQIPVVADLDLETLVDRPVRIQIMFEDDGLPGRYTATITDPVDQGMLVENDLGQYTYTPNPGYVGADSFRIVVDDGLSRSAEATVSIEVLAGRAVEEGRPFP